MRMAISLLLVFIARGLFAQNCESVIALSKTVDVAVADRQSVETAASNFCSAFSQSNTSGSSSSLGVGYGPLSVSFGGGSVDAAAVASRYCSASNRSVADTNAYRTYVESIAPAAYHAYETCLKYSQKDLKFSSDQATILPNEFTITALYSSNSMGASTKVSFSSSSDVTCTWSSGNSTDITLPSGSSAALQCKRSDSGKKSYVNLFSPTLAVDPMSVPWGAYSKDGTPIDLLSAIQARTMRLERELANLKDRLSTIEARPFYKGATPSTFTNSQRGSATPKGSSKLCGEGWVMVGFADANEVSCAQLYLVP
jgi:hypothetical protein